jgi:Flp pilus assembly protein TadD
MSPNYILSLAFFGMGLMAKPTAVTLPFVLLLLDWWPFGRLAAFDGKPEQVAWRGFGPLVVEKIPFLLLAAGSSIVTFLVQQAAGAVRAADLYPFDVRLGNVVTAMAGYLGKTVLPAGLAIAYPHPRTLPSPGRLIFAVAILLACSLVAVLARKRRPHLFTGWWWFAGMLVPVIGLVQVGVQAMADRYTYLPLVGIFLALTTEYSMFASRGARRGAIMATTGVVVVAILGVLTFRQAAIWRDAITLFTHATEVTDDNWTAQLNLANALNRRGRVAESREHIQEALRIRPEFSRTHRSLGSSARGTGTGRPIDEARALSQQGRTTEAEAILRNELARDPSAAEARYILAVVLKLTGREEDAADQYRELLRAGSMVVEASNNLGVIESQAGRLANAEKLFRQAAAAGPQNAEARNNLGLLLVREGRLDEARICFGEALALRPKYLSAMLNLADALRAAGHTREAARWYRSALGIDGANERARSGLAATGK